VTAVLCEDGAEAVASEDFAAVLSLDMAVDREAFPKGIVAVAGDEALEVAGFVQDGGEEVVVAVGGAVGGGAVGGIG
jgi:hypothetical protein